VTRIDQEGVEVDGDRVAARTTFWAAGVAPSSAATWLAQGGDKSGRVVVDGNLAVQGCMEVFAVGDTAASNGWAGAGVPGLAPAAKQQGRHVANVIEAAITVRGDRRRVPSSIGITATSRRSGASPRSSSHGGFSCGERPPGGSWA